MQFVFLYDVAGPYAESGNARLAMRSTQGPTVRLWGLVTTTYNETQHVTIITP